MIFAQDRDQLRNMYCAAWNNHRTGIPLEPLQVQIVQVVKLHPEYHSLLENPGRSLAREYLPENGETNPFLHMGMHIAIQEQVATNRPAGISSLYAQLLPAFGDAHDLEHRLMECLAEMIWKAQRENSMPDEQHYLDCVQAIARE